MRKIETIELVKYINEKLNEVSNQIDINSNTSKNIILKNENEILFYLRWLLKNRCNESK